MDVGELEVVDHLVGDDGDRLRGVARGEGELGGSVGGRRRVAAAPLGGAGREAAIGGDPGGGDLDGVERKWTGVLGLCRGADQACREGRRAARNGDEGRRAAGDGERTLRASCHEHAPPGDFWCLGGTPAGGAT